MKMKHLMLLLVVVDRWRLILMHEYTIERRVKKRGQIWTDKADRFNIPLSICSIRQSAHCSSMGAISRNNCKCICENSKSTFGFYENEWKCFENTKIHLHGGSCSIALGGKETSQVLRVMRSMSNVDKSYSLPMLVSTCDIDYSYLMCNGEWGQMDYHDTSDILYTTEQQGTLYLMYSTDSQSTQTTITGRVMRLHFECPDWGTPTVTHCAVFKISGKQTCSITPTSAYSVIYRTSLSPSPTPTPTPTPLPSSSSLLLLLSPSPSSTPRQRPSGPSPTPSLSSDEFEYFTKLITIKSLVYTSAHSAALATEKPTSGNNGKTNNLENTTTTVNSREKDARSDDSSSSVVGGVLAGVSGLLIVVIAIIVIMRRRMKRNTESKSTVIAENEGYGRGVDNSLRFNNRSQDLPDEDEYSYAYNNVAPFVKTNKPEDLESHNKPNLEPERSVANLVYGHTEGLNQMASPSYNEAPVYNTLEDAVYAKVDKTKKACPSNSSDAPIYNTLEEPEYAKLNRGQKAKLPVETQDESLYNVLERPSFKVLEGPFPEDAPVYDVLEGPESDEALGYGALEGQDPHAYGALDKPDNQGPPEENRGYDDMVYDSVGDVINDQGDIYQELNQGGQRDSDVYQALNYPGNTMHLNEIKQAHSNA